MGLFNKLQAVTNGSMLEMAQVRQILDADETIIEELSCSLAMRMRDIDGILVLTNKRVIYLQRGFVAGNDLIMWALPTCQIQARGVGRMAYLDVAGPEGQRSFRIGIAMQGRSFQDKFEQERNK
jgi:ABC-type uncharacterized transport system permease subunit